MHWEVRFSVGCLRLAARVVSSYTLYTHLISYLVVSQTLVGLSLA